MSEINVTDFDQLFRLDRPRAPQDLEHVHDE